MLSNIRRFTPSVAQVRLVTTANQLEYKSADEIPGPPVEPIWKMAKSIRDNNGRYHLMSLESAEKYGPIYQQKIPLINFQAFTVSDPYLIEDFLRQEPKFPERPPIPIWDHATNKLKVANGILRENGEEWYRMRSVINPKFMKQKAIDEYFPEMDEVASDYIKRLERLRDEKQIVHNLPDEMFNWALESVSSVLYEKRLGCVDDKRSSETDRFIGAVKDMLETTLDLFIYPIFLAKILARKSYKRQIKGWATLYEVDNQREADDEPAGLIEYMVASNKLSKKDIIANITELMAGGVDTTSNSMQFIMYELAKNPDIQNTLHQEIQEHIGSEKVITPQMIKHMSFLKAVIKETLRLYPIPNSVGRVLSNDIVLNGYLIPKGKLVVFIPYVLGRQNSFFEDAETFKPERWLRSNTNREKTHPFAYLPFGFGARGCVGRRLAETELQILVSKMFQNFRLELVDKTPIQTKCFLTISPAKPLEFYYIKR